MLVRVTSRLEDKSQVGHGLLVMLGREIDPAAASGIRSCTP